MPVSLLNSSKHEKGRRRRKKKVSKGVAEGER